jgi:hypothetical protein
MRATIALACTIVAAQLLSATGPAQAAPAKAKAEAGERWCLRTESGGSDCTYHSLAQCNATRAGNAYSFCWRSDHQLGDSQGTWSHSAADAARPRGRASRISSSYAQFLALLGINRVAA